MFNSNCGASVPLVASLDGGNGGNNGNGMWGDGGWWVLIILFALIFWGNGNWGGNNGGSQGAVGGLLTRSDLCQDMSFSQLENSVRGIADGICSLGYDQLSQISGLSQNISTSFANLNSTICQQQYDTAQMINAMNISNLQNANAANVVALQNANALQSQISGCCCDLRTGQMVIGNQIERASCDTNYNAATNTNAIIQNSHNDTDRIIARLDAMENARKDERIAEQNQQIFGLQLAASQQAQNNYLVNQLRPCPVPAYITCNPYTASYGVGIANNGYGYNGGCGCGCA